HLPLPGARRRHRDGAHAGGPLRDAARDARGALEPTGTGAGAAGGARRQRAHDVLVRARGRHVGTAGSRPARAGWLARPRHRAGARRVRRRTVGGNEAAETVQTAGGTWRRPSPALGTAEDPGIREAKKATSARTTAPALGATGYAAPVAMRPQDVRYSNGTSNASPEANAVQRAQFSPRATGGITASETTPAARNAAAAIFSRPRKTNWRPGDNDSHVVPEAIAWYGMKRSAIP